MGMTMRISVQIKDEKGNVIITNANERIVPYIEEIENQGFRAAFHDLDTAVLESRKEVCDNAVSEYLEAISEKKLEKNRT